MSNYIFDVNQQNFQQYVIENSFKVPVLVDFWAEWCQPCKMLMPILAKLAEEYNGQMVVAKVNTEEEQQLAMHFGIRGIPNVKLFRNGEVQDEFSGALPEHQVKAFIDQYIVRASDSARMQAHAAWEQGNTDHAIILMEQVVNEDPKNLQAQFDLTHMYLKTKQIEKAQAQLKEIPPSEQDKDDYKALVAQINMSQQLADAPSIETLQQQADQNNSQARHQLALLYLSQGEYEKGLEELLILIQKDRKYGEDAARKSMLEAFDAIKGNDALVSQYRRKLFNILH